ncbi:MAG: DEAD/DEAH box helicase, partial [Candidatus Paceibacterota bacterium]
MTHPPEQSPGKRSPIAFAGLPNCTAKAWLAVSRFSARGRGAVFCARDEEEVSDFLESATALNSITGGCIRLKTIQFGEERLSRAAAMNQFVSAAKGEVVLAGASWRSLSLPAPDPTGFAVAVQTVTRGSSIGRDTLCAALIKAGYERAEFVEQPGEYAARGAVVDVYPPSLPHPARLFFSGNRVESIRFFDIETQSAGEFSESLEIIPCGAEPDGISLQARLSGQLDFIVDKNAPGNDEAAPPSETAAALLYPVPPEAGAENFGAARHPVFNGDIARVAAELERLGAAGMKTYVSCLNRGEAERVSELFSERRVRAKAELYVSRLREGFSHPPSNFAVITSGDIFARRYSSGSLLKKFDSSNAKRIRFKDLKPGDFVVHEHYGVAKYLGLRTLSADGLAAAGDSTDAVECLLLEYKNSHRLFVPLTDFARVQKFVGAEGKRPRLSTLGGKTWNEVKSRVKKGVEDAAKELLRIEAERAAAQSPVLPGDPHIEREFADSFPFEETPDQSKAIDKIAADLELPKPMDRVLAGDVGFGKTEVAMRAALRCALSGRQTAVFAPTTVLAAQHFRTFSQRFAGFPVKLALLCRFQTKAEQKTAIEDLRAGAVDIVIGTHRLLSKDIAFKNLGLCIIDEEHRFGVHQKERIRRIAR